MHQKHPPLSRPDTGHYGRTEFALVGTTCERIERLMQEWTAELSPTYRCLTVTGEHEDPEVPVTLRYGHKLFCSDRHGWNEYDDRLLGAEYDLVLVNGNHYPARRQIVFVDSAKAGTLERRREQLTDVYAIVHVSGEPAVPEWLQTHIRKQHQPPLMTTLSMLHTLREGLRRELEQRVPRLQALVLAGGQSTRMGTDKSKLVYQDGKTEVQRLADLCHGLHLPVSISVRQAAPQAQQQGCPLIPDRFMGMGPMGAICSAFLTAPDTAWLVLACDLPLLDARVIEKLVANRAPSRAATAIRGPESKWPEPLVAIYEPRAYRRLLDFLSMGYACPRKMLINSDTKVVPLESAEPLTNANTPEERERVRQLLA